MMMGRLLSWLGFTSGRRVRSRSMSTNYRRALRFEPCESRRMLATFTVTSPADNQIAGDGFLTLREAIVAANQDGDPVTIINFSTNPAHGLNGATITLTEGDPFTGVNLRITEQMTIDASMLPDGITIDASGNDSDPNTVDQGGTGIFSIDVSFGVGEIKMVTLKNLTLTGGDDTGVFTPIPFALAA
jgi:hypothetical protein